MGSLGRGGRPRGGHARACPTNICVVGDAVLKARKLQSLDSVGYYTKLVVISELQRFVIRLPLPKR